MPSARMSPATKLNFLKDRRLPWLISLIATAHSTTPQNSQEGGEYRKNAVCLIRGMRSNSANITGRPKVFASEKTIQRARITDRPDLRTIKRPSTTVANCAVLRKPPTFDQES